MKSALIIGYAAIAVIVYVGLCIREWRMQRDGSAPPGPMWQGVIILGVIAILWLPAGLFIVIEWGRYRLNQRRRRINPLG